MNRCLRLLILFLALIPGAALAGEELRCGVASGFPPYQFSRDGEPAGFDVDVARAVCARLGLTPSFEQGDWDNVVNLLRFGRLDVIVGMEVNAFRDELFDFSTPYSTRHDAVFVLANSTASREEDLFGGVVTGDRHSFVELHWQERGIHRNIRVTQTGTKAEAMQSLADGRSLAAIMPLEVGRHLARERGLAVRVLLEPDPGSDVAIALPKGRPELRQRLNEALEALRAGGELESLARKWFDPPAQGNGTHVQP